MNKQDFIQLIKNPSGISPEQLQDLEKVVKGFPYCQSAYILIAKEASDQGSMLADQKLKKAAAYTLDRKNLKKLLTGRKEIEPIEISTLSQKELEPIESIQNLPLEELHSTYTFENSTLINEEIKEVQSIVSEEIKTNSTLREALTDEKRDLIIKELQENLKKLHTIKIKTAWDEVPEELKLVNPQETEEKIQINTQQVIESTSIIDSIDRPDSTNSVIEPDTIVNTNQSGLTTIPLAITGLSDDLNELFEKMEFIRPIRTEDVVVEIKESEADNGLLLEYLDFLEDKRSVFRKNKKKEVAIIDKIIKEDPTIPKLDINNLPDNSIDLASKSITINKGPVSENFAKILSLQGKRDKAIEIYEQLILKNPEKKPYFEAQIEKLKSKL